MSSNKILFKLTGSIACFKAAALISKLVQSGCEVQTVATSSALKFIGEATLEGLTGRKVLTDTFASGDLMGHINWAKWADLTIVYPATANTVNKLANGIGDDLVTTLFLAHNFKTPYLVAPAMNTKMLEHPATQESLEKLAKFGVEVLNTGSGSLACGEIGAGRLIEVDKAFDFIQRHLTIQTTLAKFDSQDLPNRKKVLITLGGTREPIDSVRSITNTSTGVTGATIADYLSDVGHDVTAVCAKSAALPRNTEKLLGFTSFADLNDVVKQELSSNEYDVVIHLAAVSDYSVGAVEVDGEIQSSSSSLKLSSTSEIKLHLKRNFKIIDRLREYSLNKNIQLIAFKLTSNADERLIANKVDQLLTYSQCDYVVHNDLSSISPTSHTATIVNKAGEKIASTSTKKDLAETLEKLIRETCL